MSYKTFEKNLKAFRDNKKKSLFAVCGEESYFRELYIQVIRNLYEDLPTQRINAEKVSESELISSFESDDLLSDTSFLEITNIEKIKNCEKILKKFLDSPEGLVVLFISEKNNKKNKIYKVLSGHKNVLYLPAESLTLYNDDVDLFIDRLCTVKRFKIESKAKKIIKEYYGANLYAIANELEKLFIFCEEKKSINLEDTLRTVTQLERDNVFEIVDYILKADLQQALKKTTSLFNFESNAEMMITYTLGKHLEKIVVVKSLLKKTADVGEIAKTLNLSPFILKKQYIPAAKKLKLSKIREIIRELSNLDIQFKSMRYSHQVLMENFLTKICR